MKKKEENAEAIIPSSFFLRTCKSHNPDKLKFSQKYSLLKSFHMEIVGVSKSGSLKQMHFYVCNVKEDCFRLCRACCHIIISRTWAFTLSEVGVH